MRNLKSLLTNGLNHENTQINCDSALLGFYKETFDECRARLKYLAWDTENGWDYHILEMVDQAHNMKSEVLVESVGNMAFKLTEVFQQEPDNVQRQNKLHQLNPNDDEPISICAPLLLAMKYILHCVRRKETSPELLCRLGELISSNKTLLLINSLTYKLSDELDDLITDEASYRNGRKKGGLQKGKNIDAEHLPFKQATESYVWKTLEDIPSISQDKLMDKTCKELMKDPTLGIYKTLREGTIRRWIKETRDIFENEDLDY